jgi:hypothetical protein
MRLSGCTRHAPAIAAITRINQDFGPTAQRHCRAIDQRQQFGVIRGQFVRPIAMISCVAASAAIWPAAISVTRSVTPW